MKVSAIFVVDNKAIELMEQMSERERMDYILGKSDDDSFESYIYTMEDYMEISEAFFQIVQNIYKMQFIDYMECLCDTKKETLYMAHYNLNSQFFNKIMFVDHKSVVDNIYDSLDFNINKYSSLFELYLGFISLAALTVKEKKTMIMIFLDY